MSEYSHWNSADGPILVQEMGDLHLLHTIRAIEEGRILKPIEIPEWIRDTHSPEEGMDIVLSSVVTGSKRNNWLIVLKAEAIKRGLDWSKAPSRKVKLLDLIFDELDRENWRGGGPSTWKVLARGQLTKRDIPEPEVDVSNLDGEVTYLHWNTERGTPL